VDPFTVETTITAPREAVYGYLLDVANHAEFTDHYLVDWHLLRENSVGLGAGARFRVKAPLQRFAWGDITIAELSEPYRIVEKGRFGKFNRTRTLGVYTLSPGASGTTRVEFTFESDPPLLSDKLMEALGARSWTRRRAAKALRRLRSILEDGSGRGVRPTVAAKN
jgi:uncharacterized protein YndB with AHSA1/START domain